MISKVSFGHTYLNQIQKKTKEALKSNVGKVKESATPLLSLINAQIQQAASKGSSYYIYPVQLQHQPDKKLMKYICKYYRDQNFKVDPTIVNANYRNARVEAITISWLDDEIRQLEEIVD